MCTSKSAMKWKTVSRAVTCIGPFESMLPGSVIGWSCRRSVCPTTDKYASERHACEPGTGSPTDKLTAAVFIVGKFAGPFVPKRTSPNGQ